MNEWMNKSVWNLKYGTNEVTCETDSDWIPKWRWVGEGWAGSMDLADEKNIEWMNNRVLFYSTGSYIQYPVINHMKNMEKNVYVCITESFFCIAEINTTL